DADLSGHGTGRLELLISPLRIRRRIAALARRIDQDQDGAELTVLIVLKGALMFGADLLRALATPAAVRVVSAASYGARTQSSGNVALSGLDQLDLRGRRVLVVDDIVDSGATAQTLLAALRQREPRRLDMCALLSKTAAAGGRHPPIRYCGFEI